MNFKKLNQQEILDALHLIWKAYEKETAPHRTEQHVEAFRVSIRYENVMQSVARQEIMFLGWYEQEIMRGTAALTPMGKIVFFAVGESEHASDKAAVIMENLKRFATLELKTSGLKVDAEQDKVNYYLQLGFCQTAREFNLYGITVVPMECLVTAGPPLNLTGNTSSQVPRKNNGLIIGIIVAAVLGFIMVCSLIGFGIVKYGNTRTDHQKQDDLYYDEYYDDSNEAEPETDDLGIESIDGYEADDLAYTFEESTYNERKSEGKYQVDFLVKYPQLNGLPEESADLVNKAIEEAAMKTVNEIYLSPDESMKEALLNENMAYLVSYVEYKVTYASNDFFSLVLEDSYYKGDISKEYVDLRSVNVNLKTGEIYRAKDIVNISGNYMNDWVDRLKAEAPSLEALHVISAEEYKKALEGDSQGGKYQDTFFVDEDGIEIGISYHYESQKLTEYGWVTAPYTLKEAELHKTQSEFWNLIAK